MCLPIIVLKIIIILCAVIEIAIGIFSCVIAGRIKDEGIGININEVKEF